jgi:hypothetical protein
MTPNNWGGYDSLTPLSEPHGQGLTAEGPCSFIHLSVHVQPAKKNPPARHDEQTNFHHFAGPIPYTNTWSIHDVHRNNNSNHATATTSAISTTTGDDNDGGEKQEEEEKTKRSPFIGSRIGIRRRLDDGDGLVHAQSYPSRHQDQSVFAVTTTKKPTWSTPGLDGHSSPTTPHNSFSSLYHKHDQSKKPAEAHGQPHSFLLFHLHDFHYY